MYRLLLLFVVALQAPAFAQRAVLWPRNAATNQIEFRGRLLWPDSVKSELQRQRLVRRWYRQGLTNGSVAEIRRLIQDSGTAYAGLPRESSYQHGIVNGEQERFSLGFHLFLAPDSAGLAYLLSDFECSYSSIDAGSGATLEKVLTLPDARVQTIMAGFHHRLLLALKGWK